MMPSFSGDINLQKYRWARASTLKDNSNLTFCVELSEDTETVVEPHISCCHCDIGKYELFMFSMRNIHELQEKLRADEKMLYCPNYLNGILSDHSVLLRPCDPFYKWGIDVLCATSFGAMYSHEGVEPHVQHVPKRSTTVGKFMKACFQLSKKLGKQPFHALADIINAVNVVECTDQDAEGCDAMGEPGVTECQDVMSANSQSNDQDLTMSGGDCCPNEGTSDSKTESEGESKDLKRDGSYIGSDIGVEICDKKLMELKANLKKLIDQLLLEERGFMFWDYLQLSGVGKKQLKSRLAPFGKRQLDELIIQLLCMDNVCSRGPTLLLAPFNVDDEQASGCPTCCPDLVFHTADGSIPIQTSNTIFKAGSGFSSCKDFSDVEDLEFEEEELDKIARQYRKIVYDDSGERKKTFINLDILALWQSFEQLLGVMLDTEYLLEQKKVIFQTGLLIQEETVLVVVLAMDTQTYASLKEKTRARNTVEILREQYANLKRLWCRYYVLACEFNLYHLRILCRHIAANHCQGKESEN